MIGLLTGLPGHGKTLYLVSELRKLFGDRQVYVKGIPDLKLPWIPFDDVSKWRELPPNSVLVVDEAQMTFPLRGAGDPPEWIKVLTTHRHLGLDIWLVTQHPALIDVYVRRLVGEHRHLHRALGMQRSHVYTWDRYDDSFMSPARKKIARESNFAFPKESYALYKSAEIHTVKRTIPKVAYVLVGALIALGVGIYATTKVFAPPPPPVAATNKTTSGFVPGSSPPGATQNDPAGLRSVRAQIADSGQIWREPQYAKLVEPKRAPTPSACIVMPDGACRCYTEDATIIRGVPESFCRDFVGGYVFAEWRAPANVAPGAAVDPKTLAGTTPAAAVAVKPLAAAPVVDAKDAPPPISISASTSMSGHRSSNWTVAPKYR